MTQAIIWTARLVYICFDKINHYSAGTVFSGQAVEDTHDYIVASELKDPICHSDECQIGSFSSEATIWTHYGPSVYVRI